MCTYMQHFLAFLNVDDIGSWKPSLWRTRDQFILFVNTMADDDMATQRTRSSAALVLVLFCLMNIEYSKFQQKEKEDWYLNLQQFCFWYTLN